MSHALKSNWKQELIDYQMMCNSTPNTTTGKTPSELFYRRQFRDKLSNPTNIESTNLDDDARDRDKIMNEKGKQNEDRKRRATEDCDIEIGDKVYQKNISKPNKITPNFKLN